MSNVNAPSGAKAFNTLVSTQFTCKGNSYASSILDSTPIFAGDFVSLYGGANGNGVLFVKQAQSGDTLVGQVLSIRKFFTLEQYDYREPNTEFEILVIDDPLAEFEIQANGTITSADIGKTANIIPGTGNVYVGISAMQIDVSTLGIQNGQVLILGIIERYDNTLGAYAKVRCKINDHYLNSTGDSFWQRDPITNTISPVGITDNLYVPGKLTVVGLIDPTAILLSPQTAPPAGSSVDGATYYDSVQNGFFAHANGTWDKLLRTSDIPNPILLQGDWNANTNTPDITGTTITGYAWRVSVAGNTPLGGITGWLVGDLAVKTATSWLKIHNSDIAAVWGNITGTLSNQTDLQNALNAKLDASLADAKIWVGDAKSVPQQVSVSGEASLSNIGALTLSNDAVIAKTLTGFVSAPGTITATDSILSAIQKLDGNISTENLWDRSSTTLSPHNSGDNVNIPGSGNILYLGTQTDAASPGITLITRNSGFAAPSIIGSSSNGDKWVFWNGVGSYKGAIGFNSREMWFQSTDVGVAANRFKWFGGSAGSPVELLNIGDLGFVWNDARSDIDFSIRKSTSGDAYTYDFGLGSHQFTGTFTLSSLTTANGILRTDGAGLVTSSVDLPNGTTATTQTDGDNTTKLATTAFVQSAIPYFINQVTDSYTATLGQTSFTLSQTRNTNFHFLWTIDGLIYEEGVDFTISGTTLTWNGFTLTPSHRAIARYYY
jgi:hypothetical protein